MSGWAEVSSLSSYKEAAKKLENTGLFSDPHLEQWNLLGTTLHVDISVLYPDNTKCRWCWFNILNPNAIQTEIPFKEAFELMPPEVRNEIIYHLNLFV